MNSLTPIIAVKDNLLAHQLKELINQLPFMQPPIECQLGTELLTALSSKEVNVLFWGADLPDMKGLELFDLKSNLPQS